MASAQMLPALLRIPLDQIEPGPNARGDLVDLPELAASLSALGQQVPIIVEQVTDNRYRVIEGHRRLAAAKLADLPQLDAVLRRATTATDRLIRQVAMHTHVRPFDPMAEARALHGLMFEHKMTREQIAQLVGRSPGWVRDRVSLVHLAADEQRDVERGRMSVAEALLRLKNRREQRDGRPPTQGYSAGRADPAGPTRPTGDLDLVNVRVAAHPQYGHVAVLTVVNGSQTHDALLGDRECDRVAGALAGQAIRIRNARQVRR